MKNNFRILKALLKLLDVESFYVISIYLYSVNLQADFDLRLAGKLARNKFEFTYYDGNGYPMFTRGNIEIALT